MLVTLPLAPIMRRRVGFGDGLCGGAGLTAGVSSCNCGRWQRHFERAATAAGSRNWQGSALEDLAVFSIFFLYSISVGIYRDTAVVLELYPVSEVNSLR